MNGFGVIRIFLNTLTHVRLHHVVKDLEGVADDNRGVRDQLVKKPLKRNSGALLKFTDALVEAIHGLFDTFYSRVIVLNNGGLFFRRPY